MKPTPPQSTPLFSSLLLLPLYTEVLNPPLLLPSFPYPQVLPHSTPGIQVPYPPSDLVPNLKSSFLTLTVAVSKSRSTSSSFLYTYSNVHFPSVLLPSLLSPSFSLIIFLSPRLKFHHLILPNIVQRRAICFIDPTSSLGSYNQWRQPLLTNQLCLIRWSVWVNRHKCLTSLLPADGSRRGSFSFGLHSSLGEGLQPGSCTGESPGALRGVFEGWGGGGLPHLSRAW